MKPPNREANQSVSGSEFRDRIAAILRLRYSSVELEVRLATTTADVIFTENSSPLLKFVIAVEAKYWARALTSADIASIDNLYRPAINSGEIDYLWIIGNHVLASSPRDSISRLRKVSYLTINSLRSSLMNFEGLLMNNVTSFTASEAARNFVAARVRGSDETMLHRVQSWISSDETAMVIFGGYGLGKTTFSLYVANVLSSAYREGASTRIPVRLPLGALFTKQDLNGLVSSALSGSDIASVVQGYNFHLFLETCQQGDYLLILDGFDEMRHAMDLADFIYTFEQLKSLFQGRSKVLILGRPDSFLSDREEERVFSSLFDRTLDSSSKYIQVEIDLFSPEEVSLYLSKYLNSLGRPLNEAEQGRFNQVINHIKLGQDDILLRPIQLRMFTQIFEDFISG